LTAAAVVGAPGYALRTDHGNPESTDYLINPFAQLDAHNWSWAGTLIIP
jgi:hypothetical protein